MVTYYRDPEVLVTSAGVRAGGRAYRLGELIRVWHRRGRHTWTAVAGRGVLGLAMLAPIGAGAVGIAVALALHGSAATTIALVGGGILLGFATVPLADVLLDRVDRSYDRGSRRLEIWGRTRHGDVLLLATRDAQRFGQVYRALQRALDGAARSSA
jgi:xanthosine utilization system XapX-like protein